jgi:sterol desaturase/sphingolipid hydroxylase (fatty acid hydroxylase superfamily)
MFPFYEYVFHRFVLHMRPSSVPALYALQRIVHYDHHEETQAIAHYFAPIWISAPLVLATGALYHLIDRGQWPITLGLLWGNLAGFLFYEWVHYRAHEPLVPLTPWGRYMKKYHLWHHHKNETLWFGVTSPLIDRLAGTYRPVAEAPASPTTHHLHGTRRAPIG